MYIFRIVASVFVAFVSLKSAINHDAGVQTDKSLFIVEGVLLLFWAFIEVRGYFKKKSIANVSQ